MNKKHFTIIGFWRFSFFAFYVLFGMILHVNAQETAFDEGVESIKQEELLNTYASPDKSTPIMLSVVGGDARINSLTIGRGSGARIENTVLGRMVLNNNTSGYWNSAFGEFALENNSTGLANTALGAYALRGNTTGSNNIGIGGSALLNNGIGSSNVAVGRRALYENTSGLSNVAVGVNALNSNTIRSNLVAVGDSALFNNGLGVINDSLAATANTALGSKALYANTTGRRNTATGFQSLYSNTSGGNNTAIGYLSLYFNTTGFNNTASGHYSLYSNTTGHRNTAYGFVALYSLTTGSNNTAIGSEAGSIGSNISQGTFVGASAFSNTNNLSNVTGIGFEARPSASNQVRIGNSSVTSIGGNVGWTIISDGNYKANVTEDLAGLDFILKLRPVSYNLDVHKLAADLGEDVTFDKDGNKALKTPDEITLKSRNDKASIRYTGFIAQEVEATVNELGVAFSGVDAPTNKESYYGLRYADFVLPLVKAVQEQQQQIESLAPESIELLRMELKEVSERNQLLEARNQQLERKINEILAMLGSLGLHQQPGQWPDGTALVSTEVARLDQNTPNPFRENTLIRYFLPQDTRSASIIVTDINGMQLMSFTLKEPGSGQVIINGGSLNAGTYIYTLLINGQRVDAKRMVLVS